MPIQHVFFDCDSTLVQIEGIVELARLKGKAEEIATVTEQAMSGQIELAEVFSKRLEIVQPSVRDLEILGRIYCENLTLGAESVVKQLQNMGKQVYILSAGYRLAIEVLASFLGIPKTNIFVVDLQFTDDGEYRGLDTTQVLIKNTGKRDLLQSLGLDLSTVAMVGDGANDLVTQMWLLYLLGFWVVEATIG
jgi:Haloacid Dehalogenase superfamily, subfamily IB, phosphoserine phosphatase-like